MSLAGGSTITDNGPISLERERAAEELAPVPGDGADGREALVWAEFAEVAGGSTAWVNLVLALDSADTEVGHIELMAQGETRSASAYWDWAWNTYQLAMMEVGDPASERRRLAYAYNLDDLGECTWCNTPDLDHNLRAFGEVGDEVPKLYHLGCLAETLREQGL